MPFENPIVCPYCGHPNPNVKMRTKGFINFNAGINNFGGQIGYEGINQKLPLVTCSFCDRKFYLYADSSHNNFCRRILANIKYNEIVAEFMLKNQLNPSDIIDGFQGLTQIKSMFSCVNGIKKKIDLADDLHIVFEKWDTTYYMIIKHSNRNKIAVNMEVAL